MRGIEIGEGVQPTTGAKTLRGTGGIPPLQGRIEQVW